MKQFSSDFEWANYKIGILGRDGLRRQGKSKGKSSAVDTSDAGLDGEEVDCSWNTGQESAEPFILCVVCLLAVFTLRSSICYVIEHILRRPIPDALLFPAWEGKQFMDARPETPHTAADYNIPCLQGQLC